MSTSKSFQNQQGFVSYRPNSPKLNSNSPTSLQTNQNHTFVPMQARGKLNSNAQVDHFASIKHENTMLKEENKALKRQLHLMKGEYFTNQSSISSQSTHHEVNDLRETIKKEAGEIKELKTRLEVVSKQCKMYEQIIDKMQGKINKINQQNKILESKLKQMRSVEKNQKEEKFDDQSKLSKQKLHEMSQKVIQVLKMYSQLEEKVQLSDKEWQMWKQQWVKQKSYYLNRIHDLQAMMGIGVETKQFYKKRF